MLSPDERALIERARHGCQDATGQLYLKYQHQLTAHCFRMLSDWHQSEEIMQDSFISAIKNIANTSTTSDLNLSAWLYRIATNRCLDVLRRRKVRRWTPWVDYRHDHLQSVVDPQEIPERSLIRSETDAMVQTVLGLMSEIHRTSLVMREFGGLSCEEIGAAMDGASRSAVKSRLFRARDEFRAIYRALYGSGKERVAA